MISTTEENQSILDIPIAGILVANMIQDYLQGDIEIIYEKEKGHDIKNSNSPSREESLCISSAIDDGTGAAQSGEH